MIIKWIFNKVSEIWKFDYANYLPFFDQYIRLGIHIHVAQYAKNGKYYHKKCWFFSGILQKLWFSRQILAQCFSPGCLTKKNAPGDYAAMGIVQMSILFT